MPVVCLTARRSAESADSACDPGREQHRTVPARATNRFPRWRRRRLAEDHRVRCGCVRLTPNRAEWTHKGVN